MPVQQDGAPGGLIDLGEQVKHRGLACAVGPDESGDLRAANGQVEVVHRLQAAEVDAQMAALQNGGLIDVPLGDDRMAGHRHHLTLFKFLSHSTAAPFRLRGMILPSKPTHLGVVCGQHNQDQHDGIHQHTQVSKLPQGFWQNIEHHRCDDGTPNIAQAA